MKAAATFAAILLSATYSFDVAACGESLYRVGKGVAYRGYSAPLPANLLVFADTERARQVAEALAKSGHGVRLVSSENELTDELRKGGYDVVIAPSSARSSITGIADSTTFLAVAEDADEAASDKGRKTLRSDSDIRQYLKAIHRSLKKKSV